MKSADPFAKGRRLKPPTVQQKQRAVKITKRVPAGIGHGRVFYPGDVFETRFRLQWQDEHERRDLLAYLLDARPGGVPIGPAEEPAPITERDRVVAATLVQWLGTNVGRCFLAEALARGLDEIEDGVV